ncbi:FtsX-like permease family protein [Fulvivirga sp. M361]|uniref:ABC transporter permease n=1 Tax=Fulvivirga sp. M361 TaxID=2594266 RepID=UPI00117BA5C2|nr:ABC transporter permease [Fulvivirga sp. M361]TRX56267.1 FtsX-like permease family protein [Fulvivirga sp. M361]
MIKNYLKIAIRNLLRHRAYSFINIFGLTIGLTSSSLLILYLQNELSYDTFHEKSDRIARVVDIERNPEEEKHYGRTSALMGPQLVEEFSEVINQTSLKQPFGHIDIYWKGERFHERNWAVVDSSFFKVFDFDFIEGDRATALHQNNSIVLTETTARKYFGDEAALGKMIEFLRLEPMKVTGIIEDVPLNSQLQFDFLITYNSSFSEISWWDRVYNSWERRTTLTYVELVNEYNMSSIKEKVPGFIKKYRDADDQSDSFYLQPLKEVYLNSAGIDFDPIDQHGNWFTIYLFSAIAAFILMIAGINYINLATSRSMERALEIGIRKVVGAAKSQLVYQFLSEAVLISLMAFLFSVGLLDVLLPGFNDLAGVTLTLETFSFSVIIGLLGLALFIGLVSGSYPALYLAHLRPSESLKAGSGAGIKGAVLRKILVIVQFTLSITMIVATLVVSMQMDFIKNKDLGFDKERILVIDINDGNVRRDFETMKIEFSKIPGVKSVACSSRVPGEWKGITELFIRPRSSESMDSLQSFFMCLDSDMLDTYSLELLAGRNFSGILSEDSTALILNETAAAQFGGIDAIGREFFLDNETQPFKIIGIVKDFNFQSLHAEVAPLTFGFWHNPINVIDYFSLKIEPRTDLPQMVESAKKVHESFDNFTSMEYHFLDDQLDLFYKTEERTGKVFLAGAVLTILIACLGLFGLASFMVRKRVKEVSIRKVLGASVGQLFLLLSRTFIVQVIISTLIAIPVSWWTMDAWLSNFTFKVSIQVGVFIVAGLLALVVALITTSYQSVKATLVNPADTLRNE